MRFSFAMRAVLVRVVIVTAAHGVAFGQSTFGANLGTVHDESGAVMPGCAVTVENKGTSVRRSTITDETGSYNAQNLEPGSYRVRIELPSCMNSPAERLQ